MEVEVARPRDEVWAFVTDVARLPEWVGEFVAARKNPEGPTRVGTVVHYTVEPGARTGTYEIVEWDPPRRLAWDGPPLAMSVGAARPRGSFDLAETGQGATRVRARFQPELLGLAVPMRRYLKRWLRRRRAKDSRVMKGIVEREASA